MTAVEVLQTIGEICGKNSCQSGKCPFDKNTICIAYAPNVRTNAEETVAICEQWRKDHPIKTYADIFFEQFPNAKRYHDDSRIPQALFTDIYGGEYKGCENDAKLWIQPYPGEVVRNE